METNINKEFDQLNRKYTVECGGEGNCFAWSAMYAIDPSKIPAPQRPELHPTCRALR